MTELEKAAWELAVESNSKWAEDAIKLTMADILITQLKEELAEARDTEVDYERTLQVIKDKFGKRGDHSHYETLDRVETQLVEAWRDSERLDALERLVEENKGGLLIHHQISPVTWRGVGLGLSHRNLRKAIDQASYRPATPKEPADAK